MKLSDFLKKSKDNPNAWQEWKNNFVLITEGKMPPDWCNEERTVFIYPKELLKFICIVLNIEPAIVGLENQIFLSFEFKSQKQSIFGYHGVGIRPLFPSKQFDKDRYLSDLSEEYCTRNEKLAKCLFAFFKWCWCVTDLDTAQKDKKNNESQWVGWLKSKATPGNPIQRIRNECLKLKALVFVELNNCGYEPTAEAKGCIVM